jgi:hypothetical protein
MAQPARKYQCLDKEYGLWADAVVMEENESERTMMWKEMLLYESLSLLLIVMIFILAFRSSTIIIVVFLRLPPVYKQQ